MTAQAPFLQHRRNVSRPVTASGPATCDTVNDSSLAGYWKLNEASGNATDSKGANTLTDNNSVGTAAGIISTARSFDSAFAMRLSSTDNAALSSGDIDFTVGAWVYYAGTLAGGSYPGIIGKWDSGAQNEYLLWLNGDDQRYEFSVSGNGSAFTTLKADTFGDPSDNTWHYILAWHDSVGNTLNIQVDGGTVDSVSYSSGGFDGTADFHIGSITTTLTWLGRIDEAFFTKRVLTSGERTALYGAGAGCLPAGL